MRSHTNKKKSLPRSEQIYFHIHIGGFWTLKWFILHFFICQPLDSTVSEDSGMELWQSKVLTIRPDLIHNILLFVVWKQQLALTLSFLSKIIVVNPNTYTQRVTLTYSMASGHYSGLACRRKPPIFVCSKHREPKPAWTFVGKLKFK